LALGREYDELLDRASVNQNVKVIRYKQCSTQGRNILISSTRRSALLAIDGFGPGSGLNLEISGAAAAS